MNFRLAITWAAIVILGIAVAFFMLRPVNLAGFLMGCHALDWGDNSSTQSAEAKELGAGLISFAEEKEVYGLLPIFWKPSSGIPKVMKVSGRTAFLQVASESEDDELGYIPGQIWQRVYALHHRGGTPCVHIAYIRVGRPPIKLECCTNVP